MVDSTIVLNGQTIVYTLYCIAILLLMSWFGYKVTKPGGKGFVKPGLFYSFVGLLVVLGVSLHIITYNTIPWTPIDLNRENVTIDKSFDILVDDHQFILSEEKLVIKKGEKVSFNVTSNDLTYGFGVFREDNSMVFQMQVIPGHKNDVIWQFTQNGNYSIRSTEYSGPEGIKMFVKDAIEVID